MDLYCGMDLHGNNVFCTVMDREYRPVFERRLPNDLAVVLESLAPYQKRIASVAVESTFNWYWLVDGLQAQAYRVRLANPARMEENIGLKCANDKTDARFLAKQMVMGVLPEGYIYPREERPVRDLLRRRMGLVQTRTAEWLSLESRVARHSGLDLGMEALNHLPEGEHVHSEAVHVPVHERRKSCTGTRTGTRETRANPSRPRRFRGNRPTTLARATECKKFVTTQASSIQESEFRTPPTVCSPLPRTNKWAFCHSDS